MSQFSRGGGKTSRAVGFSLPTNYQDLPFVAQRWRAGGWVVRSDDRIFPAVAEPKRKPIIIELVPFLGRFRDSSSSSNTPCLFPIRFSRSSPRPSFGGREEGGTPGALCLHNIVTPDLAAIVVSSPPPPLSLSLPLSLAVGGFRTARHRGYPREAPGFVVVSVSLQDIEDTGRHRHQGRRLPRRGRP